MSEWKGWRSDLATKKEVPYSALRWTENPLPTMIGQTPLSEEQKKSREKFLKDFAKITGKKIASNHND
ncbi:hypothetical protein BAU15_06040 [Enterococcus sp. JM4C]|uniref:hypothetical protein n=1 Tax=Candidatus Enterococcus huntleyi TaxID=1857217 RepID=UPI00137AB8F2|nr:hypothetical protein [Enterococcus sp. JM4C]KAF1297109.1 hypothetical protein BAU15_06040 [Enterococcus sp. JM4C]